jgi:predicted dehydrogenase
MTLRWGFLGASGIGRRALAPSIQSLAGHAVHAVAARDPARARAYADSLDILRVHPDYAALIADPAIDIVYVALTNDAHAEWSIRALDAGKHVLCEKPLALNGAEVAAMVAAASRNNRLLLEAFSYRFHPQFARLQALLASGAIGRLVALSAAFTATMPAQNFRWQHPLGGGALYDLGCYATSILRLAATREPISAAAIARMRGEVDATLTGLLDFGDGVAARLACSFEAPFAQHLSVTAETAALALDWPFTNRDRVTTLTIGETVERFAPMNPYAAMAEHFGDAALGREPLRFPPEESLAQARALDALFRAALTRHTVPL